MRLGLIYANVGGYKALSESASLAEKYNLESIWVVDHSLVPKTISNYPYTESGKLPLPVETPLFDPFVSLAYLGTRTNAKLGAFILAAQRHPAHVAKSIASIENLSGIGRTILGVGIGWCKAECEWLGIPFSNRVQRTEETVKAIRSIWREVDVYGPTYKWENAVSKPTCDVPIIIGGSTVASAKRAAQIGDGYFPVVRSLDELNSLHYVFYKECETIGIQTDSLDFSVHPVSGNMNDIYNFCKNQNIRLILGADKINEVL